MNEVTFVPTPTAEPAVPRPSASVILLRDGAHGLELLLLRRAAGASFMAGAFVFPGGTVDPHEHALGLLPGARHAAVRECFEECALLLADGPDGQPIVLDHAAVAERFAAHRMRLLHGDLPWDALCAAEGLRPWTDALVHVAHWITPIGAPKRFDTHFFLAPAPSGQQALHDGREVTEHVWIRPHDALARQRAGELTLVTATRTIVASLAEVESVADALARARRQPVPGPVMPRIARDAQGRSVVVPGHPAYAEIGRLDPQGDGQSLSVIVPGEMVMLSARVRRLTAPNPGVMTGPGTNTYLLDGGSEGAVVIDPGPDDATHVERILAATQGRIQAVLVTHDHLDHRPAAVRLQAETGAAWVALPRIGREASEPRQHVPADGELLRYGALALQALHTPGHASSHLCFMLPDERLLFSGDHVCRARPSSSHRPTATCGSTSSRCGGSSTCRSSGSRRATAS